MNLIEACRYFLRPTEVMLSRVRVEGVEHLQSAAARGRGILVLTAHYGNWELLAAAHGLTGLPLSFVIRPLDHPVLDELAARFRRRSGAELIVKRQAVREVLQALRRGRMVGILLDQNATRAEGVFVPFFGVAASTSKGLAVLALRTEAPVVPVFLRRTPQGRSLHGRGRPRSSRRPTATSSPTPRRSTGRSRPGHPPCSGAVALDARAVADAAAREAGS